MVKEGFILFTILAVLMGLFILSDMEFQKGLQEIFNECMAEKKDKWTCQAVVDAKQAKQSADIAAGLAVGTAVRSGVK